MEIIPEIAALMLKRLSVKKMLKRLHKKIIVFSKMANTPRISKLFTVNEKTNHFFDKEKKKMVVFNNFVAINKSITRHKLRAICQD